MFNLPYIGTGVELPPKTAIRITNTRQLDGRFIAAGTARAMLHIRELQGMIRGLYVAMSQNAQMSKLPVYRAHRKLPPPGMSCALICNSGLNRFEIIADASALATKEDIRQLSILPFGFAHLDVRPATGPIPDYGDNLGGGVWIVETGLYTIRWAEDAQKFVLDQEVGYVGDGVQLDGFEQFIQWPQGIIREHTWEPAHKVNEALDIVEGTTIGTTYPSGVYFIENGTGTGDPFAREMLPGAVEARPYPYNVGTLSFDYLCTVEGTTLSINLWSLSDGGFNLTPYSIAWDVFMDPLLEGVYVPKPNFIGPFTHDFKDVWWKGSVKLQIGRYEVQVPFKAYPTAFVDTWVPRPPPVYENEAATDPKRFALAARVVFDVVPIPAAQRDAGLSG